MPEQPQPTPYRVINELLARFLAAVQAALGPRFVGMYLSGSLALGDFDPKSSDIDLVVVVEGIAGSGALADEDVAALRAMHAAFDGGSSPASKGWAGKLEVIYVTREAVRHPRLDNTPYPQVEKESGFFVDRLEDGWLAHCYTVREHGVVVAGPEPATLFAAVDPDALRRTVARIPEIWLNQAHNDPSWLEWLRSRPNQSFVTLTLCRLLYTLETGAVASKPAAARWAQETLGGRWAELIERAQAEKNKAVATPEDDVQMTVALVEYTVERFRNWQ